MGGSEVIATAGATAWWLSRRSKSLLLVANYSRSAFAKPGKDRSMQSTGTVMDNRR